MSSHNHQANNRCSSAFKSGTSQADAHIKAQHKPQDVMYDSTMRGNVRGGAVASFRSKGSQADAHIKAERKFADVMYYNKPAPYSARGSTSAFRSGTSQADAHIKAERKFTDASYEPKKCAISSSGARAAFKWGSSQADAHIKAERSLPMFHTKPSRTKFQPVGRGLHSQFPTANSTKKNTQPALGCLLYTCKNIASCGGTAKSPSCWTKTNGYTQERPSFSRGKTVSIVSTNPTTNNQFHNTQQLLFPIVFF